MATTSYAVAGTHCVDASGATHGRAVKIWESDKTKSAFKAYINISIYWFVIGQ